MTTIDPAVKAQHVDPVYKDVAAGSDVGHDRLAYAVSQLMPNTLHTVDDDTICDLRLHLLVSMGADAEKIVAELVRQGMDPRDIIAAAITLWKLGEPNPPVASTQPAAAPATAAPDPFSVPVPGTTPAPTPAPAAPTTAPATAAPAATTRRRGRGRPANV